jgi:tetratricopeptide (TPR) repeat protein
MRWLGILSIAVFAIVGGAIAAAQEADTGRDLSAGPIVMRITACLMAAKTRTGTPCPEPSLRGGGIPAERAVDHMERARYFIELQELTKAVEEANAAAADDPGLAGTHHLLARLALTMGNFAQAEREIAIARTQEPDDLDVHATYAAILEARPAQAEAFAELNAVIARRPDHIFARLKRSAIHMNFHNPSAALVDLDFLVNFEPSNIQYRGLRSRALMTLDRPQSAATDLTAALALAPGQFGLLAERARAYELGGDFGAALADLDTILGPVGEKPAYAIGGDQYGRFLMQRALIQARLHRLADAASDMMVAVTSGGRPSILRAQVFLRRNGFPEVSLDGSDSPVMRKALEVCFGLNACFQAIMQSI